jgi:hypothetical protein
MTIEDTKYICQVCVWEQVPYARARRCIADKVLITCVQCGEAAAKKVKHCVAPMHKSNYMLFTNADDLKGINNKGGLVR